MRSIFKGPAGVLVGVGMAAVAPIVVPVVKAKGRPIAKAAIKRYLRLRDSLASSVAGVREGWAHLVAEARAERAAEHPVPAAPPAPTAMP
jgi:hypothetical protein